MGRRQNFPNDHLVIKVLRVAAAGWARPREYSLVRQGAGLIRYSLRIREGSKEQLSPLYQ